MGKTQWRTLWLVMALLIFAFAWATRYQYIPGGPQSMYRGNRWTGELFWVRGSQMDLVKSPDQPQP